MRPSGKTTSCWWAWSSSTARRREEGPGRRGFTGKHPNRCRNQPCRPTISSTETMKRQSRPVRRRPAAWGSNRASQRDRWVGASSTGPSEGRCSAPSTVSSRKNRGRARSWVTAMARGANQGLTPLLTTLSRFRFACTVASAANTCLDLHESPLESRGPFQPTGPLDGQLNLRPIR